MSSRCLRCGLGFPGEVAEADVCRCGQDWGQAAPFLVARSNAAEWEQLMHLLMTRSGVMCEARTPACEAPGGSLYGMPRERVSIHHRQPRGMGGTRRLTANSLAVLMLVCGTGVTGCHGYVERNREWALAQGFLVPLPVPDRPTDATNPVVVPITLYSGRRVCLDPLSPFYGPPADGIPYAS
jgi:hypothetical protein